MARRARHAPGVLRAAAVGLLAGLAGAGLARAERAPTTTATPMGLVIPLYFHRDYSEWARVAEAAARIPVVAVVSDNYNTPGRKVDPKLAAAAQDLLDAGVNVMWYVYTRDSSKPCCYCCEDIAVIKQNIQAVLRYNGTGIFFDKVFGHEHDTSLQGTHAENLANYTKIVDTLKGLAPDKKVMCNGPGHAALPEDAPKYMGMCDWSVWMESWEDNFRLKWDKWCPASSCWKNDFGPERFAAILHGRGASFANMESDLRLAKERGMRWFYHTDTPYQHLPTYYDQLVDAIEKINEEPGV